MSNLNRSYKLIAKEEGLIQQHLYDLITTHEDWLMHRVLYHARLHNYTQYTSTLEEAWRMSIQGLSESLMRSIKDNNVPPEFGPDDDFTEDPIASFGILEAQRHRSRGVTLSMFLGLMKYYKQGYIDLVMQAGFDGDYEENCRLFIERFFDRVEIGFNVEWSSFGEENKTKMLQSSNRTMTNEKNKYLTIFESTPTPVIFLNTENVMDSMNHAAAMLVHGIETPGVTYYTENKTQGPLPWKIDEVTTFLSGSEREYTFEKALETKKGIRHFQIKLKRMLDVSQKFSGIAFILNDITERKLAEDEIRSLLAEKELLLREVHHRIKNNMNTINGLLTLQAETLKDSSAIAALKDSSSRVRSMMTLYDKLYQSAGFNTISVMNYLPSLVDEIVANFPNSKSVKIEKKIDDFILDAKRLQSLGIIINELLTNIMKYAFTGRNDDSIMVSATLTNNRVSLVIEDNGVGMPESINFESSPGFGIMLVGILTKQLDGTIRIEREIGTRIILEFEA